MLAERFTSSMLVNLPNPILTDARISMSDIPIALRTYDGSIEADEQADPVDIARPLS